MVLKSKKGQKELGMIFGLFILLIITLVVLGIFFKAAKKTDTISGAGDDYFKEADKQKAIAECESKCQQITDQNSAIEFCAAIKKIDWNGNKNFPDAELQWLGSSSFCEDRIPCFILAQICAAEKGYSSKECGVLLKNVGSTTPRKFDQKGELKETLASEATCDDNNANWITAFEWSDFNPGTG